MDDAGAPTAQLMDDEESPLIAREEQADFPPLKGGGKVTIVKDLAELLFRCRICCIDTGCFAPVEPVLHYLCIEWTCQPCGCRLDTDFNSCCYMRLFCLKAGCHEPCFKLENTQFWCFKC